MTNLTATRAFHVMSKPTGAICNLDCEYCFFLSKEELYPGSGFRMDPVVHEAYISQLLAAHQGVEGVVVAFQGGEPTMMGLDFFRRTLELERRHARPDQRILNTVQTNATLLDDEWAEFFKEHDFLVGVSIDGPREMHDAYRVDKGGKPTFDRVLRGLQALQRNDVDWNALTTINAANGDHGRDVYRFLRDDLGAAFVQLIPIVERVTPETLPLAEAGWGDRPGQRPLYRQEGHLVTHRTVGAEQYGRFLVEVFEEWARHDVGDVFVSMFDTALAHWMGMDQVGLCVHARTCGCSWSTLPSSVPSATRGSSHSRRTAAAATSGSPATAAVPRTASWWPPTAKPDFTTSARGSGACMTRAPAAAAARGGRATRRRPRRAADRSPPGPWRGPHA